LVEDEIHLQLAVDGSDRVGTEPFGAILTLQHTASIERSSGGFARYLMEQYMEFNAGQWTNINYQERLRKSIESSFSGKVELLGIGFFQPLNPAAPIRLAGQTGWQEKPLAYLVLQAVDPSVDRLPAVQMDMHFNDASGPIVLPVVSNTVLVDASAESAPRPVADLVIEQTLDPRPMLEGQDDRTVKLEVVARSTGVLPEIDRLLKDLQTALPGYTLDQTQLVSEPYDVNQTHRGQPEEEQDTTQSASARYNQERLPNLDPDPDGLFRLGTMRKWIVSYVPENSVALSPPEQFTYPEVDATIAQTIVPLAGEPTEDQATTLVSSKRYTYEDYDLVPVEGQTLAFNGQGVPAFAWGLAALAIALPCGGLFAWRRRRGSAVAIADPSGLAIPDQLTPTGAALLLSRIERSVAAQWSPDERAELRSDMDALQRQHFASAAPPNGEERKPRVEPSELLPMVQRWAKRANAR